MDGYRRLNRHYGNRHHPLLRIVILSSSVRPTLQLFLWSLVLSSLESIIIFQTHFFCACEKFKITIIYFYQVKK